MLSPASLRVCCLAVMAPALTKADRRADCLSQISEPLFEAKTAPHCNRKDIGADYPRVSSSSKLAYIFNYRRKAFTGKEKFRTHFKNNSPEFYVKSLCSQSDLHNSKLDAESKNETWHGTSVTIAVANKVRLKYTMNKNSSSLKNMGLARTNASISLHNSKKGSRITQFSPQDRGNPSTPDIGESSPDLPRSTNSELETGLITERDSEIKITLPVTDVSSVTGESVISTNSDSNPEREVTLPVACASPAATAATDNCNSSDSVLTSIVPCNLSDLVNKSGNKISSPDPATAGQSNFSVSASSPLKSFVTQPLNSSIEFSLKSSVASEIPCSNLISDHYLDKFQFIPEDFLISTNKTTLAMGVKKPPSVAQVTSENIIKPKVYINKVPKMRNHCVCHVDPKELINEKYDEHISAVLAALEKSELVYRLCAGSFTKREINELVHNYQKKLGIPCQKQLKKVSKHSKEMVDLKTELLQNEEVKSMSTAALVNLVRKLESSGSPGNLLPSQNMNLTDADTTSNDPVLAFNPEEVADVIRTSKELHSIIKRELQYVDPDLTESSDDSESDIENLERESIHKTTCWKYMKERAALTCRSTWLIARIHELENHYRTANGALQKHSASLGKICFEEEPSLSDAAFYTALSGEVNPTNDNKQKVKSIMRPVNGYLDNSISNIAHIGQNTCVFENIELNEDSFMTDVSDCGCSRTRALNMSQFQKREVLVTNGLHFTSSKLTKLSSVGCHCSCQDEVLPCVLCLGRYQCVQSVDPDSMPLLERVSLLDSNFHPLLSFKKDVPLILHFENILKKNESQYQVARPASPTPSIKKLAFGTKPKEFSDARSRSRKFSRYARTLSAKYRNKHLRNTKHLRKHGLVFGKWRRYQNRSVFQARERFERRRISIESSDSSLDSPVPSPGSLYEESFDGLKRKRDENQFDIDDVIIPYSNKSARLVEFEFKDIIVPSFRIEENEMQTLQKSDSQSLLGDSALLEESISDETFITRHEPLEIDEKKINKRPSVMNLVPLPKRSRREQRLDSRADSSGANTPDPTLFCDQDMFQDHNATAAPTPPALSPPTTPSSVNPPSDDSQPSFASNLTARLERRKATLLKRLSEESQVAKPEAEEVTPYELRSFPLSDEQYEEIALDPYGEDPELTVSGPSSPASPGSTTLSTSTIEDVTDPEWMVLRNNPALESGLKLKLAKR